MFYFEKINGKKILKSTLISNANAFFTTRDSVVTAKDMSAIEQDCKTNIADIANYLDIAVENIVIPCQKHSDNIAIASPKVLYTDTDALVINRTDIAILLNFADCTPVIIYDEHNNIGAIAHAGWRGTAKRIVPKTVAYMHEHFNSNIDDICAIIGPAISAKNYQVSEDVYQSLKATLNGEYTDSFEQDNIMKRYNVDLKNINLHQLEELGIKRIDKCDYCTYDSNDVFFSYRRENGNTARHSAILKLNY